MKQLLGILFAVNLAIVVGFEQPTIFYMGNVMLHLLLGVLAVGMAWSFKPVRVWGAASLLTGLALAYFGALSTNRPLLWAHIALSFVGAAILVVDLWRTMPALAHGAGHGVGAGDWRSGVEACQRRGCGRSIVQSFAIRH